MSETSSGELASTVEGVPPLYHQQHGRTTRSSLGSELGSGGDADAEANTALALPRLGDHAEVYSSSRDAWFHGTVAKVGDRGVAVTFTAPNGTELQRTLAYDDPDLRLPITGLRFGTLSGDANRRIDGVEQSLGRPRGFDKLAEPQETVDRWSGGEEMDASMVASENSFDSPLEYQAEASSAGFPLQIERANPRAYGEVIVHVGSSKLPEKCIISQHAVACAPNAGNRDIRRNLDTSDTMFEVVVLGGKTVCAKRLDKHGGWNMQLQILCNHQAAVMVSIGKNEKPARQPEETNAEALSQDARTDRATKCAMVFPAVSCGWNAANFGIRADNDGGNEDGSFVVDTMLDGELAAQSKVCVTRLDGDGYWSFFLEFGCNVLDQRLVYENKRPDVQASPNNNQICTTFPGKGDLLACPTNAAILRTEGGRVVGEYGQLAIDDDAPTVDFEVVTSFAFSNPSSGTRICARRTDAPNGWDEVLSLTCSSTGAIKIGASLMSHIRCVTLDQPVTCLSTAADKGFRLNSEDSDAVFDVTTAGFMVCVRRTDRVDGWSMNLHIGCNPAMGFKASSKSDAGVSISRASSRRRTEDWLGAPPAFTISRKNYVVKGDPMESNALRDGVLVWLEHARFNWLSCSITECLADKITAPDRFRLFAEAKFTNEPLKTGDSIYIMHERSGLWLTCDKVCQVSSACPTADSKGTDFMRCVKDRFVIYGSSTEAAIRDGDVIWLKHGVSERFLECSDRSEPCFANGLCATGFDMRSTLVDTEASLCRAERFKVYAAHIGQKEKQALMVSIGASDASVKCVPVHGPPLTCAKNAGDFGFRDTAQRASTNDNATFEITVRASKMMNGQGFQVCARRTDAARAWDLNLVIVCSRVPRVPFWPHDVPVLARGEAASVSSETTPVKKRVKHVERLLGVFGGGSRPLDALRDGDGKSEAPTGPCLKRHPRNSPSEACWRPNPACSLPFVLDGSWFNGCMEEGNAAWCATTKRPNRQNLEEWEKCSIVACTDLCWEPHPACVEPFLYEGLSYSGCIKEGSQAWCSKVHQWESASYAQGDWQWCTAVDCHGACWQPSSACVMPFLYNGMQHNSCVESKARDGHDAAWCSQKSELAVGDSAFTYCKQVSCSSVSTFGASRAVGIDYSLYGESIFCTGGEMLHMGPEALKECAKRCSKHYDCLSFSIHTNSGCPRCVLSTADCKTTTASTCTGTVLAFKKTHALEGDGRKPASSNLSRLGPPPAHDYTFAEPEHKDAMEDAVMNLKRIGRRAGIGNPDGMAPAEANAEAQPLVAPRGVREPRLEATESGRHTAGAIGAASMLDPNGGPQLGATANAHSFSPYGSGGPVPAAQSEAAGRSGPHKAPYFTCDVTHEEGWQEAWSAIKKGWCCDHVGIGCTEVLSNGLTRAARGMGASQTTEAGAAKPLKAAATAASRAAELGRIAQEAAEVVKTSGASENDVAIAASRTVADRAAHNRALTLQQVAKVAADAAKAAGGSGYVVAGEAISAVVSRSPPGTSIGAAARTVARVAMTNGATVDDLWRVITRVVVQRAVAAGSSPKSVGQAVIDALEAFGGVPTAYILQASADAAENAAVAHANISGISFEAILRTLSTMKFKNSNVSNISNPEATYLAKTLAARYALKNQSTTLRQVSEATAAVARAAGGSGEDIAEAAIKAAFSASGKFPQSLIYRIGGHAALRMGSTHDDVANVVSKMAGNSASSAGGSVEDIARDIANAIGDAGGTLEDVAMAATFARRAANLTTLLAPFSCDKGYAMHVWPVAKQKWCCEHTGKGCETVTVPTLMATREYVSGRPDCPCIGQNVGVAGIVSVTINGQEATYPSRVGASCGPWDLGNYPEACVGEKPALWCKLQWCYVDPCTCGLKEAPQPTAYVFPPGANVGQPGKPLFYSYATCRSDLSNVYIQDLQGEGGGAPCVAAQAEATCLGIGCAWVDERCVDRQFETLCRLPRPAHDVAVRKIAVRSAVVFYGLDAQSVNFVPGAKQAFADAIRGALGSEFAVTDVTDVSAMPRTVWADNVEEEYYLLSAGFAACGTGTDVPAESCLLAAKHAIQHLEVPVSQDELYHVNRTDMPTGCSLKATGEWAVFFNHIIGQYNREYMSICVARKKFSGKQGEAYSSTGSSGSAPKTDAEETEAEVYFSVTLAVSDDRESTIFEMVKSFLSEHLADFSRELRDSGEPAFAHALINKTATCDAIDSQTRITNVEHNSTGERVPAADPGGHPACPCIGDRAHAMPGGYIVASLAGSGKVNYPLPVGATCGMWDNDVHPDCEGSLRQAPYWCRRNWCFVDPCNCAAPDRYRRFSIFDASVGNKFTPARFQGKPLVYSYSACGSTEEPSEKDTLANKLFRLTQDAVDNETETLKHAIDCKTEAFDSILLGVRECRCIGISGIEGVRLFETLDAATNRTVPGTLSMDMGATCGIWSFSSDPSCASNLEPAAPWCQTRGPMPWCFVDPNACSVAYLEGKSTRASAKPYYFSNLTCLPAKKDLWKSADPARSCLQFVSRYSCESAAFGPCHWTDGRCMLPLALASRVGAAQSVSAQNVTAQNVTALNVTALNVTAQNVQAHFVSTASQPYPKSVSHANQSRLASARNASEARNWSGPNVTEGNAWHRTELGAPLSKDKTEPSVGKGAAAADRRAHDENPDKEVDEHAADKADESAPATCDTFHSCGALAVLKEEPELYKCKCATCNFNDDYKTCCVLKAKCTEFPAVKCPLGYTHVEHRSSNPVCRGYTCDAEIDAKTCCYKEARDKKKFVIVVIVVILLVLLAVAIFIWKSKQAKAKGVAAEPREAAIDEKADAEKKDDQKEDEEAKAEKTSEDLLGTSREGEAKSFPQRGSKADQAEAIPAKR